MDTQMAPAHGHNYEEEPHGAGLHSGDNSLPEVIEGEDEHHEKKSVLKKVKDKAKKIKDTLGIRKHDHGHNNDHDHDEEEDEHEEIEEDPEVHGAPMYESTAARNFVTGQEENSGQPRVNLGHSLPLKEDPDAPKNRPEAFSPGNHQTKVTDPKGTAGGEEVGVTPILRSFGKMNVFEKPEPEQKSSTGSHDQFSSDSPPTNTNTNPQNLQSLLESFDARKPEDQTKEKNSSATSVITDKAISTKNVVASKLGYGGNSDGNGEQGAPVGEYGRKIADTVTEKLAPVYEKVAGTGSAVVSKMHGEGPESEGGVKGADKGISVKEYLTEKFKPSDEDKALSEVISEAMHKRKEEPEKVSQQAQGKVTESPEVARRLGSDEKNSGEGVGSGNESPQKAIVDRVRGAVTSWFGKGGEVQESGDRAKNMSLVRLETTMQGRGSSRSPPTDVVCGLFTDEH
ncbi:hypothetical protein HHK36_001127 [Tetracentron sinense]|uniref:Low-temperature-induced 65 kDa protein n=1 Tax=Tetracentron sinense TaxID=13715 RepID=A0A835A337_TETSI|nr:hypothetical protein HHK36_001127 [Tetracentron sinense]